MQDILCCVILDIKDITEQTKKQKLCWKYSVCCPVCLLGMQKLWMQNWQFEKASAMERPLVSISLQN